jgi:hypothetical protein
MPPLRPRDIQHLARTGRLPDPRGRVPHLTPGDAVRALTRPGAQAHAADTAHAAAVVIAVAPSQLVRIPHGMEALVAVVGNRNLSAHVRGHAARSALALRSVPALHDALLARLRTRELPRCPELARLMESVLTTAPADGAVRWNEVETLARTLLIDAPRLREPVETMEPNVVQRSLGGARDVSATLLTGMAMRLLVGLLPHREPEEARALVTLLLDRVPAGLQHEELLTRIATDPVAIEMDRVREAVVLAAVGLACADLALAIAPTLPGRAHGDALVRTLLDGQDHQHDTFRQILELTIPAGARPYTRADLGWLCEHPDHAVRVMAIQAVAALDAGANAPSEGVHAPVPYASDAPSARRVQRAGSAR